MESITAELLPSADRKRDAKGHRYYTAEVKERLLREYRASGLTQRAFADKMGVKYCTLTSWIQGVRTRSKESGSAPVVFKEVNLPQVAERPALVRVLLPDGTRICGRDVRVVAALIQELRRL